MSMDYNNATEAKVYLSSAPNSNFRVGAYLKTVEGKDFQAGNVEHENSMLNMCAERLVLMLAKGRNHTPLELHLVSDNKEPITPCGVCRQYMAEFPKMQVHCWSKDGNTVFRRTVKQLLPRPYYRKK